MMEMTLRMNRAPLPFRKAVTLTTADACPPFFLANFNGTGALDTYTPDTGDALESIHRSLPGVGAGAGSADGNLNNLLLDGSGKLLLTVVPTDGSLGIQALRSPTAPASANYYLEVKFSIDLARDQAIQFCMAGRVTDYLTNNTRAIGIYFESDSVFSNTFFRADQTYETTPATLVDGDWSADLPELRGVNSLTFRVEWEGSEMRFYINTTLYRTVTWSGTTEFDAAGLPAFGFNPAYDVRPPNYIAWSVDYIKAGPLCP